LENPINIPTEITLNAIGAIIIIWHAAFGAKSLKVTLTGKMASALRHLHLDIVVERVNMLGSSTIPALRHGRITLKRKETEEKKLLFQKKKKKKPV
jgi:hypothetical protein